MTTREYRQMSETAEGRKEVHGIMLNEIRIKMDKLVASAPEANKTACQALTDKVFSNIQNLGNADLFDYFADERIGIQNFLRNMSKYAN